MAIQIAIVEDDSETREDLQRIISSSDKLFCRSTFGSAEAFLKEVKHLDVSVVLMDINLPNLSGIDCVSKAIKLRPEMLFMIFTSFEDNDNLFAAMKAGASGYLLKNTGKANLEDAIIELVDGGSPMSPSMARKIAVYFNEIGKNQTLSELISPREKEVLSLAKMGLSNKLIAERLSLEVSTIPSINKRIYKKLNAHSRAEAIDKYYNR